MTSTTVRTAKSKYTVEGVTVPTTGPAKIVVRQPSGRVRHLGVADVGRARFDAAVTHFLAQQRAERAAEVA